MLEWWPWVSFGVIIAMGFFVGVYVGQRSERTRADNAEAARIKLREQLDISIEDCYKKNTVIARKNETINNFEVRAIKDGDEICRLNAKLRKVDEWLKKGPWHD